jgi:hypothetical protein
MPDLRESYTLPVERNETWDAGPFASETAECAWATEAIFFVRALRVSGDLSDVEARVQISPDGMHWADEGTVFRLPGQAEALTFAKVSHFGGWLRFVGEIPDGASITLIVYLTLKG